MQKELFGEGLTLMLAGMGTVFVFLTALVVAMYVMSKLVLVAAKAAPTGTAPAGAAPAGAAPVGNDDEIAAIAAAIAEHRRK